MLPLLVVLEPGSLNNIANIVKGYAIAIGVAVAIFFVWMWWAHRQRERAQELSARSRGIYAGYLRTALQHPHLAEPMVGGLDSAAEQVRYRQFVAAMLAAADEILLLEPTPGWQATLARQLAPHASYLASEEFRAGGLADCSPMLRGLIDRVIGAGSAAR